MSPSIANVFRLYSSLVAGLTVTDLCVHNDLPLMGINERLVKFVLRVCWYKVVHDFALPVCGVCHAKFRR